LNSQNNAGSQELPVFLSTSNPPNRHGRREMKIAAELKTCAFALQRTTFLHTTTQTNPQIIVPGNLMRLRSWWPLSGLKLAGDKALNPGTSEPWEPD